MFLDAEIGITGTPKQDSNSQKSMIRPLFFKMSHIFKATTVGIPSSRT